MEQKAGQLPSVVEFYRELMHIQGKATPCFSVDKQSFAEDACFERLSHGIPLLSFKDLSLDWVQVRDLFQETASALAQNYPSALDEMERLKDTSHNIPLLEHLVSVWYDQSSLAPMALIWGTDRVTLAVLAWAAINPFLSIYSKVLSTLVNQESWRRGYCPICGGKPDFACLEKAR